MVATNVNELKELLVRVKVESEALRQKLNVSKTMIMRIRSDGTEEPVIVSGDEAEQVTRFNFLGSLIY